MANVKERGIPGTRNPPFLFYGIIRTEPPMFTGWKRMRDLVVTKEGEEEITQFHLPGQHDQSSHGKGGGGDDGVRKLFNLNDGKGGFEKQLRIVADAIGVDPYDVNIKTLKKHAADHERERKSRYPFKSPCWASRTIDFTVHRWLPALLQEKYPDTAQALLETSPRWGKRYPDGAIPLPEMATGNIALVEFHLEGQHDQSSHGRPGSGGGLLSAKTGVMEKEVTVKKDPGSKNKAALTKAETALEDRRAQLNRDIDRAIDNDDNQTIRDKTKEFNQINKELHTVRKDIYTPEDLNRIQRGEEVSSYMRNTLKSYDKAGIPVPKMELDILEGSSEYWANDAIRAKKEARGQKVPGKPQAIGKTLDQKKGEWPDEAGVRKVEDSNRPIKQIANAGLFGKESVDGLPVKRAYEIEAKDGTNLRLYDMAGGRETKNSQEMLNTVASMHELYPHVPPKKLVIISNMQTQMLAGPGTNAFVYPGSDYIFVNKSLINKMNTRGNWMMPGGKTVPAHQYIITHEYGHQFDAKNDRGAARGMFENNNVRKHLSTYGKSMPEEGYAEAFAEWHVTKGQTKNPAAVAYARQEKWYGNDRVVRSAEGAKLYGVSIGQKIPIVTAQSIGTISLVSIETVEEWDPWNIAEELGIISFSSQQQEEDVSIVSELFPKDVPIIIEDFENGAKFIGGTPSKATEEEKKAAEKVAREVWTELGLKWEE